jgi:hypothetical protein
MPLTFLRNLGIVSAAGITTTKLGAGAVLQVVNATDTTHRSTTSTSFVTGSNTLSVSITPSSASNKVFIIVNTTMSQGSGDQFIFATIYKDATNLGDTTNGMAIGSSVPAIAHVDHPMCISFLDSPSTTSAITYQLYFRSSGGGIASINGRSGTVVKGSITAFEIKG